MQMIRKVSIPIFSIIFFAIALFMPTAFADLQTIEADGYYTIGDGPDETPAVAMERARYNAKSAAGKKAAILVESYTAISKNQLKWDEVRTISAKVLQVKSDPVNPETLAGGSVVRYHCHITAVVDSKNVLNQIQLQATNKQQFNNEVAHNNELEAEIDRVNAEIIALKKKFKTASKTERQEINKEVKRNESQFAAAQWIDKGDEQRYKKNYDNAIECYNKALGVDPNNGSAWNGLGLVYREQKNSDKSREAFLKAMDLYNKAVELNPTSSVAWNNLGRAYHNGGKFPKALECYNKALELALKDVEVEPNNVLKYNILNEIYRNLGEYDKARVALVKSVNLEPNDLNNWKKLLRSSSLSSTPSALDCHLNIIKLEPNLDNWINLAMYYTIWIKNYDEAIACFNKALELDSDNKETWLKMAWAYEFHINNPQMKVYSYKKIIEILISEVQLNPSDASKWVEIASYYEKIDDRDNVIKSLFKAIEINPNDDSKWVKLASYYEKINDYDSAIKYLFKAIEINPNDDSKWGTLALYYEKMNDYDNAIKYLFKAIKVSESVNSNKNYYKDDYWIKLGINPDTAKYWTKIADIYESRGRYQEALDIYRRAAFSDSNAAKKYRELLAKNN